MRALPIALSVILVALIAGESPSDAQKPPGRAPLDRDGSTRMSGLLAVGYGLGSGVGPLVVMQRGPSLYLCQPNLDAAGPVTTERLKLLAQRLLDAECVAVVGS